MLNSIINIATFRKGWRTFALGLITAVGPGALHYLGLVDWTTLGISPGIAGMIGSAIIVARMATNTAPGKAA